MDWKTFFELTIMKAHGTGHRPYFHSILSVPDKFPMEELQVSNFESWGLTEEEKRRLGLNLRKIIHCHHYFNTLEFERISGNFIERLLKERDEVLHFSTRGGGAQLFLAVLKQQVPGLKGKRLICETSEIPLPTTQLPLRSELHIEFRYSPASFSYLSGFPSLWARPEVIALFDRNVRKREVA